MPTVVEQCPVCGSGRADAAWSLRDRYYETEGVFEVRRCRPCRSTFVANPPDDIGPYYGELYYSYKPPPLPSRGVKPWLKRRVYGSDRLNRLVGALPGREDADCRLARAKGGPAGLGGRAARSSRVIDLGCGNGEALDVYRAEGWETWGVELGAAGVAASRARGHEVLDGDFCLLDLPSEGFDVVRASHVVEHVADPMGALRKAASLVAPGGTLLVEVPNLRGALARVSGSSYWQLDPPRHLAIPAAGQLVSALRDADFDRLAVSTYSTGQGLARTLFMWQERSRYLAGARAWRMGDPGVPRGYRFVEIVVEPLAVLTDAFRCGDSLRLVASRPVPGGAEG